jgi:hypothetical protein
LRVEAPGRQGVKVQEYHNILGFRTGSRMGWIGIQNETSFFNAPSTPPTLQ